jgi:hypothetical protein
MYFTYHFPHNCDILSHSGILSLCNIFSWCTYFTSLFPFCKILLPCDISFKPRAEVSHSPRGLTDLTLVTAGCAQQQVAAADPRIGAHVDVCHKRQNDTAGQNVTVWEGGGLKKTIISHKGTKCHSIGERRGEVKQTTGKISQSLPY